MKPVYHVYPAAPQSYRHAAAGAFYLAGGLLTASSALVLVHELGWLLGAAAACGLAAGACAALGIIFIVASRRRPPPAE